VTSCVTPELSRRDVWCLVHETHGMNALQRRTVNEAMVRLAAGDREAFDTVFAGLWRDLLSFVRHAMPGHPEAEDLAQQTLLKIFFRISDFDTSRDGVAWAFGIAIFEVRTLRRKHLRRREVAADPAVSLADTAPSPETLLLETDLYRALTEALGELTEADRSVLRPDGGAPARISPAAWRKRRQRAVDRLRAIWKRRHA
jgi:RNA polymerase sigma factor (sigma-70 family)